MERIAERTPGATIEGAPAGPAGGSPVSGRAALVAENLIIAYGDVTAVDRISFSVGRGEFVALLGPSGCGKTTTLRAIAGLNELSAGRIMIDGRPMADDRLHVPPERRPLNLVFQSYAIWPHLSVWDNVAYGVRGSGVRGRELRERVAETLAAVGLSDFGDRFGTELSGGQQQRVALARALATRPALMLYDEPLSNLDAGLRERVREQIVALHHRFGTSTVYVTHDQSEALSMADRVILMNAGRIEQASEPRTLYHRPESEFAARFVGPINAFRATAGAVGGDRAEVRLTDHPDRTLVLQNGPRLPAGPGRSGLVIIRPEYFELRPDDAAAARNRFAGTVTRAAFVGSRIQCVVECDGLELAAEVNGLSEVRTGDRVRLDVAPGRVIWVDDPPQPAGAPAGGTS